MLLASYALQAEVGDYNQTLHGSDYFVPEHYLPQRVSTIGTNLNPFLPEGNVEFF